LQLTVLDTTNPEACERAGHGLARIS